MTYYHNSWCPKCSAWTKHSFDYERTYGKDIFLLTVIVTCMKCGEQVIQTK